MVDVDWYLDSQIAENERRAAELEQIKSNACRPIYTKSPFDPDDYLRCSVEQERLANERELTIDGLIPAGALESAPQPESAPEPMSDDELAETFGPEGYAVLTRATDEEMRRQIERCWREDVPTWRKSRIEAEQHMFLKTWVASPAAKN